MDVDSCTGKWKLSGVGEARPKMQTTQSNIFISLYCRRRNKYIPQLKQQHYIHSDCPLVAWVHQTCLLCLQWSLIMTNYDKLFRETVFKNCFFKDLSTFTLKIPYSTSYLKIKSTDVQRKLWISVFTFSFEILYLNLPHLRLKLLFLYSSVAARLLSTGKLF